MPAWELRKQLHGAASAPSDEPIRRASWPVRVAVEAATLAFDPLRKWKTVPGNRDGFFYAWGGIMRDSG